MAKKAGRITKMSSSSSHELERRIDEAFDDIFEDMFERRINEAFDDIFEDMYNNIVEPRTNKQRKRERKRENGDLQIVAEVDVLEVIGKSDESEGAIQPLKKVKREESTDLLKEASSVKKSMDVNGFQVLPSQVESVRCIFEEHPDVAVEFRAKNQNLRNACMNSLLSLVETLRQSLEELSNEDLVEADRALRYVKDAGFKVDWLEKKVEEVKEKKGERAVCFGSALKNRGSFTENEGRVISHKSSSISG